MNTICKSFNDCSADIKKWLSKQPEVKEESLTDRFLYDLSEKVPTVRYKQFTRTEEGRKTGADWEWWFIFSDKKSFAARVQAKKLKLKSDNYAGIAYTSNGKLQIERLLDDSAKDGFASFYSFYSTEDSGSTMCGGRLNDEGVFIAEANNLRNEFILKGKRTLAPKDILKFTNPVSCLFCCPMTYENGSNIVDGFKRHIENYFPTLNDNRGENSNLNELGFRETPNYILQLASGDIPEWWEREYQFNFQRTNAIITIDLRDEHYNSR
jgi:hypothetical protein